ncbi:protein BIC1-like [Cornus florida]|uniref:protein BIC1-like n=1 Tax=Cornus florida TaxID=4283 RepID=UPI0028A2C6C9|nr:protein BIC1-like [Cornus florida]
MNNHLSFMNPQPNNNTHTNSIIPAISLDPNNTLQYNPDRSLQLEATSSNTANVAVAVAVAEAEAPVQDCGRERLKKHRSDVAGWVLIPDKWGQEEVMKEWIDYSSFNELLAPSGLMSAREALVGEGRRARSRGFTTIEYYGERF